MILPQWAGDTAGLVIRTLMAVGLLVPCCCFLCSDCRS